MNVPRSGPRSPVGGVTLASVLDVVFVVLTLACFALIALVGRGVGR